MRSHGRHKIVSLAKLGVVRLFQSGTWRRDRSCLIRTGGLMRHGVSGVGSAWAVISKLPSFSCARPDAGMPSVSGLGGRPTQSPSAKVDALAHLLNR
jgi:hypothetical protein